MAENISLNLDDVAETMLITLYIRALESQRPDALIKDEQAVALVKQMDIDFARMKRVQMDEEDKVTIILRNREFDHYARDFMEHRPQAVVVHFGCGLDGRFERVDNGAVEWYDLDLPEVIELRRQLIGGERERYHLLSCSVFEQTWFNALDAHRSRPLLFMGEGVFMYFKETQVKALVLALKEHFPGSELVFDAFSPFLVRANNLRMALSKIGARYNWGLKRGEELEGWGPGICLLDEWGYFDHPEPRLAKVSWMRHIPLLARVLRIYHYRLG
jgi:methyltransferase (TIGR00027 family)